MDTFVRLSAELLSARTGRRLSPLRARQIVFTNFVALMAVAVVLPYTLWFLLRGAALAASTTLPIYLAAGTALLLLYRGKATLARHLILGVCNFWVFAMAVSPRGNGTETLFFALIATSLLIFCFDEWPHLVVAVLQPFVYFVLVRTTTLEILPVRAFPAALLERQHLAADLITAGLLIVALTVFLSIGQAGERRADATKRQLAREIANVKLLQEVAVIANHSNAVDGALATTANCVAERTGWSVAAADTEAATALVARAVASAEAAFLPLPDVGALLMAFPVARLTRVPTTPAALLMLKPGVELPTDDLLATMRGVCNQLETLAARLKAQSQNEETRVGMMAAAKMAMIGEMYSGIAHEINNPLSVIQGYLSRIERAIGRPDQEERIRGAVADVHATIHRITRIIVGLRGFARDSQREPFETVSVARIVQDSVAMLEERLKQRQVVFAVTPAAEDLVIECRPTQISQVLVNLLNNACDAVEKSADRQIRVTVADQNDMVVLTVADTGHGVPADVRDKIMRPFFTTKPAGKGTGLGLSISDDIVQRHGGWLTHEAKAKDEHGPGETRFHIHLPKRVEI